MIEILTRVWNNLIERTEGPMYFRFFIQPAVALFFAIRAGIRDAKRNQTPYLWRWVTTKGKGKEIASEGWKDFGKIFILATVLDIIYQLILIYGAKKQASFYPLESIIVGFLLSFIPYILIRGPLSRVIKLFMRKNKPNA